MAMHKTLWFKVVTHKEQEWATQVTNFLMNL